MAAVELVDFRDIIDSVMEQIKVPSSDSVTESRIKRSINMTYVNEVAPFKTWPWLRKQKDIIHAQYLNTGTAAVTEGSTSVVLSDAPSASKLDYFFKITGYEEIYKISAHTAASANVTLSSAYTGDSNSAASYKIWTDRVDLPTDCRETYKVRHDFDPRPMIGKGKQALIDIAQADPIRERRPLYYTTDDFVDPTPNDAETESDRFRVTRVWPSVFDKDTTLHVDYIQDVTALDADGDEPVLPIEDRVVLVYGALRMDWVRERDPEMAALNDSLFKAKLARMAAKVDDSLDNPRLEADDIYMNYRRNRIGRGHWN